MSFVTECAEVFPPHPRRSAATSPPRMGARCVTGLSLELSLTATAYTSPPTNLGERSRRFAAGEGEIPAHFSITRESDNITSLRRHQVQREAERRRLAAGADREIALPVDVPDHVAFL